MLAGHHTLMAVTFYSRWQLQYPSRITFQLTSTPGPQAGYVSIASINNT